MHEFHVINLCCLLKMIFVSLSFFVVGRTMTNESSMNHHRAEWTCQSGHIWTRMEANQKYRRTVDVCYG